MATRADAGRSGARRGMEKRKVAKGPGKGSRDLGEPAGQMKQKKAATEPHRMADQVAASTKVAGRGR